MRILLLLALITAELPPYPPGAVPHKRSVLSPKHSEHVASLGKRMAKLAAPVPAVVPNTNLMVSIARSGNSVVLSWTNAAPPFQVQSSLGFTVWKNVGASTSNYSQTVPVTSPNCFYRIRSGPAPPTESGITLGMGGMNFPTKMAHRSSDNLHGLMRGLYGTQNDLFLWYDTLDDIHSISLPGNPTSAGCVTDFFDDNRLAYAERSGTTNRVIEWALDDALTNATIVTSFGFDHPYSAVCSCTYSNRPVIISTDNDVTNLGQMAFMFVWKDAAGAWQQQRLVIQSSTSDTLPTPGLSAVAYHGSVYAFFTRDSSGAVGLVKLSGEPLSVIYSNASWLRYPSITDTKLLISGEAPTIWASVDAAGDRILLAYQCQDGQLWTCVGMENNSTKAHMSVVALHTDDSPYLVAETEWYDSHTSFGILPVWSDASGVTFNTPFWSLACDWDQNGVQGARFDYGAASCKKTWFVPGGNAQVMSYSDDGYCVIFTEDWMNHLCLAK